MGSDETLEAALDRRIGDRIRARRMALGLTQDQLAQGLGVSYQQVQKYEGGSNRIAAARLARVSHILSVPVAFFLSEPDPEPELAVLLGTHPHGGTQRAALDIARGFAAIADTEVRHTLAALVRAVVDRQA